MCFPVICVTESVTASFSWNTCLLSPCLSVHTLSGLFHAGHQTGSPFSDLGLVTSEPREEESSDFLGKRKLNLMAGEQAPRSSHLDPHSLLTGKAGIRTQTCLTLAHFGQRPLSQKKGWPGSAAGPEGAWTRQCSVFSTWPCEHQRAGQAEKPGSWVQVQEMAKRM